MEAKVIRLLWWDCKAPTHRAENWINVHRRAKHPVVIVNDLVLEWVKKVALRLSYLQQVIPLPVIIKILLYIPRMRINQTITYELNCIS